MRNEFAAYVRSLGPDGGPPDIESFDAMLDTLRGALIHEMKRRSVWNAPPSFLGVYGGGRWSDGDLLEELLLHCYQFIFLQRLASLRRQLEVRSNLDGLIFLNIRHFLYESQRRHDPLGLRLYEIAHSAVERLLAAKTLHVLDGDPRVRNATVLGFAAWRDPQEALHVDLSAQAKAWCDVLLPDLVTARGKEEVVERLAERIARLPDDGVDVFRFRDLLDPLKDEVRGRWGALHADGEATVSETREERLELVKLVRPEHGFEERQSFAKLLGCVGERLESVEERVKTRDYLRRLWLFLRQWASEPETGSRNVHDAAALDTADQLPSDMKLGELLGIPRARIPGLKETLGGLLERCRASLVRAPSAGIGEVREQVRGATGQAAAALAAADAGLAEHAGAPPRQGEVFMLGTAQSLPVEWLIVDDDGRGRLWVAPVDQAPFDGGGDVTLARGNGADLHVRCGLGTWADAGLFDSGRRVDVLGDGELELVRARKEREVDADPESQAWLEQLAAASSAFAGGSGVVVPFDARRRRPERRFSRVVPALAAGLAVAALGLSAWMLQMRAELEGPRLVATAGAPDVHLVVESRSEPIVLRVTTSDPAIYLDLSALPLQDTYLLELRSADRTEVVWHEELAPVEDERLLVLPRRWLRDDEYRLLLYGEDRTEPLDERIVRIVRVQEVGR